MTNTVSGRMQCNRPVTYHWNLYTRLVHPLSNSFSTASLSAFCLRECHGVCHIMPIFSLQRCNLCGRCLAQCNIEDLSEQKCKKNLQEKEKAHNGGCWSMEGNAQVDCDHGGC